MKNEFTDADLESYLDETLHPDLASNLEQNLQEDKSMLARLSHINGRRDAGIHTLGEIWRRNQIGVPDRDEIEEYLRGGLTAEHARYIDFRINVLKCRYTIAHVEDIESENAGENAGRRKKYFDSSAGLLRKQNRAE